MERTFLVSVKLHGCFQLEAAIRVMDQQAIDVCVSAVCNLLLPALSALRSTYTGTARALRLALYIYYDTCTLTYVYKKCALIHKYTHECMRTL
jgi:hypothetical protein